jgi:hypothetical protein
MNKKINGERAIKSVIKKWERRDAEIEREAEREKKREWREGERERKEKERGVKEK